MSRWIDGYDLIGGRAVKVPEEIVGLVDATDLRFWQASDGLGAGSSLLEAAIQGLCELSERDSLGLWSFKSVEQTLSREVDPNSLHSDFIVEMSQRIATADLYLRLFDITSDLHIPAFLAVITPTASADRPPLFMEVASGTGAHPVAAKAAQRAVLEAAQTRLTTISGARDDIGPEDYQRALPDDLRLYTGPPRAGSEQVAVNVQFSGDVTAPRLFDWILDRFRARRIGSAVLVSLDAEEFGFSVARMLVPDLEQDPGTKNRRLGRRAIATMMGRS